METQADLRARTLAETPLEQVGVVGGFFSGTLPSIAAVWQRRELLSFLVRRELKSRYKDSSLGFLWSLARPLTQLLIYYVVIGTFLGSARSIDNFAIYVFSGLTAFTLFSEIVGLGTASIVANSGLVKKIYLPREVFPLATVGSSLFNFAIQLVILTVASALLGSLTLGANLFYFVGALIIILLYATALAFFLSATNVYLRDIQYLVEVVLTLLMWASPIVYSWPQVAAHLPPWLAELYLANPVTIAVLGFHEAFWKSGAATTPAGLPMRMVICGVIGVILLWASQRVFSSLEGNFAQEL